MRRFALVLVVLAVMAVAMPATVTARQEQPPISYMTATQPPDSVAALNVEAIKPDLLLAEDAIVRPEPGPLRFALPLDVSVTPDTDGTWEPVPGGWIWRLRVIAPGATDLNFGFGRYWLPKGATLHVASLSEAYFQGPYTEADNQEHGQLWTPVVPGSEAMIELYVPDGEGYELELVRIGRGYRDLFRRDPYTKSGSCNINVICPLGDNWRDQIRAVAVYGTSGSTFCTGTLVNNIRQDKKPFFLTANHCEITSSNAASVVVYWNFQSSSCSTVGGGTLNQSTSGSTWRASNYASDFTLLELSSQPSSAYNVYYAGFDARTTTAPQSSIGIHHPNTDEKAISYNDDPLTTVNSCIGTGGSSTHWQVNNWEQGTTEPGSSGSALFDPATKLVVGTLSGGSAACGNSLSDCYGKMSSHWGSGMSTWLDPDSTGTRYVAGMNAGSGGNSAPTANFTSSVSNLTVTFTDTSVDSDGTVTAWSWNFGDSSTSTTRNPSHTYAAAGTYTVSLTVTDNAGATGSTSKQVTVSSGGGVIELTNNTPVANQAAGQGTWLYYRINVPSGSTNLVMQISGGTGDADLYTRFGSQPTSTTYDCRPYQSGNTESCTVAAPSTGYYYLGLNAYSAFSGVTVKASYTTGGTPAFALSASPTSVSVAQGSSGSSTITSTVSGGFNSAVALTASGAPTGTTATLSPTSIAAPGSGTSTLTLAVGASTAVGTYTITVTGTGGGLTKTATVSLTVTASGGGGVVDLTNNVALTNQSAATGTWKHYRINVPAGSTNLVMQISGGTGDADLYTRFGSQPTSTTYDCRPYLGGNTESCTVAAPSTGYYYLGVYAYSAFATLTVKASYTTGGGGGTELVTNGGFESGTTPWVFATYSTRTSGSAQAGTYKAQQLGRGTTTSTNFYQPIAGFNGATKTLTFYLKISSAEGTTTAYDYLYVRLKNTSGTTVSTLGTYTNKNKTTYASWKLVTLTVPASALANYRISFDATEDSSAQTTFYVDSVSIK